MLTAVAITYVDMTMIRHFFIYVNSTHTHAEHCVLKCSVNGIMNTFRGYLRSKLPSACASNILRLAFLSFYFVNELNFIFPYLYYDKIVWMFLRWRRSASV